eukprot:1593402-Rhodomonas_salina.1
MTEFGEIRVQVKTPCIRRVCTRTQNCQKIENGCSDSWPQAPVRTVGVTRSRTPGSTTTSRTTCISTHFVHFKFRVTGPGAAITQTSFIKSIVITTKKYAIPSQVPVPGYPGTRTGTQVPGYPGTWVPGLGTLNNIRPGEGPMCTYWVL